MQLSIEEVLKLSGSEQLTLATRGYKIIKKVNEGSYAKVDNYFAPYNILRSMFKFFTGVKLYAMRPHRFISQNTETRKMINFQH